MGVAVVVEVVVLLEIWLDVWRKSYDVVWTNIELPCGNLDTSMVSLLCV